MEKRTCTLCTAPVEQPQIISVAFNGTNLDLCQFCQRSFLAWMGGKLEIGLQRLADKGDNNAAIVREAEK